ncbi:MAG: hypothetical protein EZS28_020896 [Streblomastix strix]|uniref:DDE-1 domain-containing protein n=1 Tax=Streblomastix strix TaxID=222440 RepID=A0A5J4VMA2_9EUKA|nr:MAG: hypothetical protein EZS28_020896 [Streblomastix strix]
MRRAKKAIQQGRKPHVNGRPSYLEPEQEDLLEKIIIIDSKCGTFPSFVEISWMSEMCVARKRFKHPHIPTTKRQQKKSFLCRYIEIKELSILTCKLIQRFWQLPLQQGHDILQNSSISSCICSIVIGREKEAQRRIISKEKEKEEIYFYLKRQLVESKYFRLAINI